MINKVETTGMNAKDIVRLDSLTINYIGSAFVTYVIGQAVVCLTSRPFGESPVKHSCTYVWNPL
jgi:hypothetical protein